MFRYNSFWHFWYRVGNRFYFNVSIITLGMIFVFALTAAIFFPTLWVLPVVQIGIFIVPVLITVGSIAFFLKISNLLYEKQNQHLQKIKDESLDAKLISQIDYFLNRRVVCPRELLNESYLDVPGLIPAPPITPPLLMEDEEPLDRRLIVQGARNPTRVSWNDSIQLIMKTADAKAVLSEIAAREMAELVGFKDLIPANTLGREALAGELSVPILSRQKISEYIETTNAERQAEGLNPIHQVKNSPKVEEAVATFILKAKTAAHRRIQKKRAEEAPPEQPKPANLQLTHVQTFISDAKNGDELYLEAVYHNEEDASKLARIKEQLLHIDEDSFQDNFLLHLVLGSQNALPEHTLFTRQPGQPVMLQSINHEAIMPEDNYTVSKMLPLKRTEEEAPVEQLIHRVFPLRLWLAGLPQANLPFTKQRIEKTLSSLNPELLMAYHQKKQLFSPAAIGAQIDRVLLIRKLFEEESKKPEVTLTPRMLFLKLVDNHPSYDFLKNKCQLDDLFVFLLLGAMPEEADFSLFRHPLQFLPILMVAGLAEYKKFWNQPGVSEEQFTTSAAHHFLFFSIAAQHKTLERSNRPVLDLLAEVAEEIGPAINPL